MSGGFKRKRVWKVRRISSSSDDGEPGKEDDAEKEVENPSPCSLKQKGMPSESRTRNENEFESSEKISLSKRVQKVSDSRLTTDAADSVHIKLKLKSSQAETEARTVSGGPSKSQKRRRSGVSCTEMGTVQDPINGLPESRVDPAEEISSAPATAVKEPKQRRLSKACAEESEQSSKVSRDPRCDPGRKRVTNKSTNDINANKLKDKTELNLCTMKSGSTDEALKNKLLQWAKAYGSRELGKMEDSNHESASLKNEKIIPKKSDKIECASNKSWLKDNSKHPLERNGNSRRISDDDESSEIELKNLKGLIKTLKITKESAGSLNSGETIIEKGTNKTSRRSTSTDHGEESSEIEPKKHEGYHKESKTIKSCNQKNATLSEAKSSSKDKTELPLKTKTSLLLSRSGSTEPGESPVNRRLSEESRKEKHRSTEARHSECKPKKSRSSSMEASRVNKQIDPRLSNVCNVYGKERKSTESQNLYCNSRSSPMESEESRVNKPTDPMLTNRCNRDWKVGKCTEENLYCNSRSSAMESEESGVNKPMDPRLCKRSNQDRSSENLERRKLPEVPGKSPDEEIGGKLDKLGLRTSKQRSREVSEKKDINSSVDSMEKEPDISNVDPSDVDWRSYQKTVLPKARKLSRDVSVELFGEDSDTEVVEDDSSRKIGEANNNESTEQGSKENQHLIEEEIPLDELLSDMDALERVFPGPSSPKENEQDSNSSSSGESTNSDRMEDSAESPRIRVKDLSDLQKIEESNTAILKKNGEIISKLSQILYLATCDYDKKIRSTLNVVAFVSSELASKEEKLATRQYNSCLKNKGKEFVPLFRELLGKFKETNRDTMTLVFSQLIDKVLSIRSYNFDHFYVFKEVLCEMLKAQNFGAEELLGSGTELISAVMNSAIKHKMRHVQRWIKSKYSEDLGPVKNEFMGEVMTLSDSDEEGSARKKRVKAEFPVYDLTAGNDAQSATMTLPDRNPPPPNPKEPGESTDDVKSTQNNRPTQETPVEETPSVRRSEVQSSVEIVPRYPYPQPNDVLLHPRNYPNPPPPYDRTATTVPQFYPVLRRAVSDSAASSEVRPSGYNPPELPESYRHHQAFAEKMRLMNRSVSLYANAAPPERRWLNRPAETRASSQNGPAAAPVSVSLLGGLNPGVRPRIQQMTAQRPLEVQPYCFFPPEYWRNVHE